MLRDQQRVPSVRFEIEQPRFVLSVSHHRACTNAYSEGYLRSLVVIPSKRTTEFVVCTFDVQASRVGIANLPEVKLPYL